MLPAKTKGVRDILLAPIPNSLIRHFSDTWRKKEKLAVTHAAPACPDVTVQLCSKCRRGRSRHPVVLAVGTQISCSGEGGRWNNLHQGRSSVNVHNDPNRHFQERKTEKSSHLHNECGKVGIWTWVLASKSVLFCSSHSQPSAFPTPLRDDFVSRAASQCFHTGCSAWVKLLLKSYINQEN